jgi:hypothetical protein
MLNVVVERASGQHLLLLASRLWQHNSNSNSSHINSWDDDSRGQSNVALQLYNVWNGKRK